MFMRRRLLVWLLVITLLPALPVLAEGSLAMTIAPSQFSPGGTLHIYFTVPKAGKASLTVLDGAGTVRATLLNEAKVAKGANDLTWDGTEKGEALLAGEYVLHLSMGDMSVDMEVTIKESAEKTPIDSATPEKAEEQGITEPVETAEPPEEPAETWTMTPAYQSMHTPIPAHDDCYWCTPMDIHDEAAVWAMLIAPVTIVKGGPKEQVVLRAEPSEDSDGVGVITCTSQSVHVLETRDDGWSLVECYSSSFHNSKVKAWNLFVTGYIKTNKLTEKKPAQDYGMVIDKLTQELYLFKDGHLFSTLLISTGLYNDKQPYNETRSGEFLIVSRTGTITSDKMFGSMALRFNSLDLLHEVPHVLNADGTKNYKNTEYKLGTRASHGCIRTQRLKNEEGVNMTWLWNNISLNTKMVIWEDYASRQMDIPDSFTPLYYNSKGGTNYHAAVNCNGVKDEYLPLSGTFTYGELEEANYKELTACWYCTPSRRIAEIEEINRIHETESPGQVPQHLRQSK